MIRDTPASAFENFRSGAATDVAETDKVNDFHLGCYHAALY
jgi:hypothetical protein